MTRKLRIKEMGESTFFAPIKQQSQSEDVLNPLLCIKYITWVLIESGFAFACAKIRRFRLHVG